MGHAVLLVDDERFARTVYADYLRAAGYEVEVADGAESALALLARRRFDVLLTDVILPGPKDGLELLDAAKQLDPNIGVIVLTALDKVDPAVRAMRAGASDYLVKPVTPEPLQARGAALPLEREVLAENQLAARAPEALRDRAAHRRGRSTATGSCRWRSPPSRRVAAPAAALLERTVDGGWFRRGAHGLEYVRGGAVLEAVRPRARPARGAARR